MQVKLISFLILTFLFSFNLLAAETLCTLSSDMDSSMAKLTYELDQNGRSLSHLYQETYENNKMTSKDEINMNGLTAGGIVLLQKDKLVVVRIWSDNFDKDLGGVLYVDTLYSGISGERKQYEIDLAKNQTGYTLLSSGIEFNKMKFIAKRSKILGVIGIDKILFSK